MPRKKGSKNKKLTLGLKGGNLHIEDVKVPMSPVSPFLVKIIDELTPPVPKPIPTTMSAEGTNFVQVGKVGSPPTALTTTHPMDVHKDPLYLAMVSDGIIQDSKLTGIPEVIYNDPELQVEVIKNEMPKIEYKFKSSGKIDWQAMFNPEYFVYPEGDTSKDPFLKVDGLLELADIRGVESKEVVVVPVSDSLIAVTVKMKFAPNGEEPNGKVWSATADANPANVGDKKFSKYLTTIAETRATGRCIRGALGIRLCSYEEIAKDDMNAEDDLPIKDTTLVIIKRQMEQKRITEDEVLKKVQEKSPNKDISSLNQLNASQGQFLVSWLNKKQNEETK